MSPSEPRSDLYISADVETDGPLPGRYSLLSFGLAVVGRFDGRHFEFIEPDPSDETTTFYREMKPISDEFQPEAMAINRFDRDKLVEEGTEPERAMTEAASWITSVAGECRPVLVAYPVAFDWAFLYWYFEQYSPEGSPFGHSSCLDIRTLYQATAGTVFDRSGKGSMPDFLQPDAPHTHNALDDAIEQGELFSKLLDWSIRRRRGASSRLRDSEQTPSWLAPHLSRIA